MGSAASMSDHIRYNHYMEFVKATATINPENIDLEATFEHFSTRKGFIPLKDALDLMKRTDLYVSFDRGFDEVGKTTFDRVSRLNDSLKMFGFSSCFIGEYMEGDFMEKMKTGVENTSIAVICVTRRYISRLMAMDVAYKEFKYISLSRGARNVFYVVMDTSCRDYTSWPEVMRAGILQEHIYFLTKGEDVAAGIDKLFNDLQSATDTIWIRKKKVIPMLVPVTKSRFEEEFKETPLADGDIFKVADLLLQTPLRVQDQGEKFAPSIQQLNYESTLTNDEVSEIVQSFHLCRMQVDKMKAGLKVVKALRDHIAIPAIVEHAIRTVWFLASNNEDISDSFGQLGTCELICNALKIHVESVHVVEETCKSIWILAYKNEPNKKKFEDGGMCGIIPAALNVHKELPHIVDGIMKAICYLATSDRPRTLLGNANCCEVINYCLDIHAADSNIIAKSCRAVAHMCVKHVANQNRFAAAGTCLHISSLIVRYVNVALIVDDALGALWNIIFNNDANKALMGECNGCQAVMLAITTYSNIPSLVEQACICLGNLSSTHSINRFRLGQEGVCELLSSLCSKYMSDAPVLEKIVKAIHNTAYDDDINRLKFGKAGCVSFLLTAIKMYTNTPSTLERLLEVFITLVAYQDNVIIVSSTEVASIILTALSINIKHEVIVERICGAIRNIAVSDIVRKNLENAGIIASYKNLLSMYSNNAIIIERAYCGLVIYCDNESRAASLSTQGAACELVVSALIKHISVKSCTDISLQYFQKLCLSTGNQKKFGNNGGCKAVIKVLIAYYEVPSIVERACTTINILALHPQNHANFIDVQLLSFIAKILDLNYLNAKIVAAGLGALQNLTFNDEIQSLCGNVSTKICESLCKTLGTHVSNPELIEIACEVVSNLSFNNPHNQTHLGDCGVCPLLSLAIKKHFHSLQIVRTVCGAIQNVAAGEDNQTKCLVSGICEAVSVSLSHYYGDLALCDAAIGAIQNLAQHIETAGYLGKIGACESSCIALQEHLDNIDITNLALSAIINLTIDLDNQVYFGRCGTCQIILTCLKKHIRVKGITKLCLRVMTNLSTFEDNQIVFGENGGCELVLKVLSSQPSLLTVINETRLALSYKNQPNRIKLRILKIGDEKFDKIYNFTFEMQKYDLGVNIGDDPVFAASRFVKRVPEFAPMQSNIAEWLMEQLLTDPADVANNDDSFTGDEEDD